MGVPKSRTRRATLDGAHSRSRATSLAGLLVLAISTAALALVALPTGASAVPRVPSPACPSDTTLGGIERAAGGIILSGTVVAVTSDVGRVHLAVDSWYHRSPVPGLAPGEHPSMIDVMLGPLGSRSGRVAVSYLPQVGSRFFVAGTWAGPSADASIACGIFANTATPVGAAWLARATDHYAAMAPSAAWSMQGLPLSAPWFDLGLAATIMVLAAMLFGALAQARDPAPAT
jgi:hypothetical protein